jgi:hypothetical protein
MQKDPCFIASVVMAPALLSEFSDDLAWQGMMATSKCRYNLPDYGIPCSVADMTLWLERVGVEKADFLATGEYRSLEDFITMNPTWPLRAFVGLLLELPSNPNPTVPAA